MARKTFSKWTIRILVSLDSLDDVPIDVYEEEVVKILHKQYPGASVSFKISPSDINHNHVVIDGVQLRLRNETLYEEHVLTIGGFLQEAFNEALSRLNA